MTLFHTDPLITELPVRRGPQQCSLWLFSASFRGGWRLGSRSDPGVGSSARAAREKLSLLGAGTRGHLCLLLGLGSDGCT